MSILINFTFFILLVVLIASLLIKIIIPYYKEKRLQEFKELKDFEVYSQAIQKKE